jgi:hypothetical protein
MTDTERSRSLEPVHAEQDDARTVGWAYRLLVFLRVMAAVSMAKGLYHWTVVLGMFGPRDGFEAQATPWQVATVFFAVIDLVAAVGLWLAAPWGAVVWLTAVVSMLAVETLFPQIYGSSMLIVIVELLLLGCYLVLAFMAAREQPA